MEIDLVAVGRRGERLPLSLDVPDEPTVGDVAAAAARLVPDAGTPVFVGGHPVPDSDLLPAAGLRAGGLLGLGVPASEPARPATGVELAVVGGLAAGAAVAAPVGHPVSVGRDPAAQLCLTDAEVSRRHATVTVTDPATARADVADAGSRNGVRWQGFRLLGTATLHDGDVIQAGETVMAVRRVLPVDPVVEPAAEPARLRYNRPPRIRPPQSVPEVVLPAEPEPPKGRRFPVAAVLVPLLVAPVILLAFPGNAVWLLFLLLSPLMLVANAVSDRRSGRRDYRTAKADYDRAMSDVDAQLAALVREEEQRTRTALPDPALVASIATGPSGRLWERRPGDDDFLRLRLGLVDRPADIRLRIAASGRAATAAPEPPPARLVPVAVDLATAGVLGVAAPREPLLAMARSLLAQAATLHAPGDLGVVVLTGAPQDWEWATWLPHTEPHLPDWTSRRMVATDAAQAEARVAELRRLVDERLEQRRTLLGDAPPPGRRILLVLDGARRLRAVRGLAELLRDGPAAGVVALCLDADEASLPDECRATAVVSSPSGSRVTVRRPASAPVADVLADGLHPTWADRLARALTPVRALGGEGGGSGAVPAAVRFLDLLSSDEPTPADVRAAWLAAPGGRTTTALLGLGADGPVHVDLRRDGPHALVAGTSGSGKSELLQTLVASLAYTNPPDALTFVLVDYKGGSAFADCADLPHCVGMVTDLDGHLVGRALESLSAELRRREHELAALGAKDIEDFWARGGTGLPRLVIVVDEFASLVEEVPDFVRGVVGIGMRGRSLGVHVVLATQRPAGVVTAELRANVNLRICLRVTSTAESSDVVDTADAARISKRTPGRAFVRTGHGELTEVQAARVGFPRAETVTRVPRTAVARLRRVDELGDPRLDDTATGLDAGSDAVTDLRVLVDAIRKAAAAEGRAAPRSPWLPPLPETVTLDTLPSGDGVPLGLADRPAQQAQVTFDLDVERTGSVLVAGTVRSGRSTVLRSYAGSLARRTSPADVHLYALDCGNRALGPLATLPHTGAVVDGDDEDRTRRLLAWLTGEVARRQRLLAAGGYGSLAEQRAGAPEEALPLVVLLLDGYETFAARYAELDGGRALDEVEALLRQGPSVGVVAVVTTDRSGFSHRIGGALAARLVLRQSDRDDYAVFGLAPRDVPTHLPPGRGMWTGAAAGEGGRPVEEVQVALLDPDATGAAQAAAVERLAAQARADSADLPAARLPRRVDPLPERVTLREAEAWRTRPRPRGSATFLAGVGGDELAPVDVDLADVGPAFVVAGPPRSGRSTALLTAVSTLAGRADGSLPVLVVAPRPSPLRGLLGTPGVLDVLTAGPDLAGELAAVLAEESGPLALVVDDAELVAEGPAATPIEAFVAAARDRGGVLLAAATTDDLLLARYRGWLAAARRGRTGLLLDPASAVHGEVFDLRLPRSTSGGWPPGRALLVRSGRAAPVQVPVLVPDS